MKRRAFLQTTAAGLGALTGEAHPSLGKRNMPGEAPDPEGLEDLIVPPDGYRPPDWLRYAHAGYFEGYAAPRFPHIRGFDAKQLMDVVLRLGGNMLRFQPIGFRVYYPSKFIPVHPELGNRDLINEVSP